MKRTATFFGLILGLCVPFLAIGQDLRQYQVANELSSNIEQAIKGKERKWRLTKTEPMGRSTTQHWRSGAQELELRIFVYSSEEEASRMLVGHGAFAVAYSKQLKDFGGDEARFIDYPHFSWVGVRRGTMLVEAHGPGKDLALTKRFVRHALQELEKK
jgi:hypothetical protein